MPEPAPKSLSRVFAEGYLVQLLNHKTALFFDAFLPQFVDPAHGAVTGQIFVFGVLFVLLASCTDGLYALLGSTVGRLFARRGGSFAISFMAVFILICLAWVHAGFSFA